MARATIRLMNSKLAELREKRGWLHPVKDGVWDEARPGVVYIGSPGGVGYCAVWYNQSGHSETISPKKKNGSVSLSAREMLTWIEGELRLAELVERQKQQP